MDAEQVLAFRIARAGLAARDAPGLAAAAVCPASDVARDAALLALAARAEGVTRAGYERAVDAGELVVAHSLRGAIHAHAPGDEGLVGRALLARDDAELAAQLGHQVQRLTAEHGLAPTAALAEVAAATQDALAGGRRLDRVALHAELRERVSAPLLPWCRSCRSQHVAPMLWRHATVAAGARLDARRRYVLGDAGGDPPAASDAVRRFLRCHGPSRPAELAEWAGLAPAHARRVWAELAGELAEVRAGGTRGWVLREDLPALASPPAAAGVRLLPPGDPVLQRPNRALLAPDPGVRARLFRPVASPGAVLVDGRLAGLWRAKAKGRCTELAVEPLGPLPRPALEEEAERVTALRGADGPALVVCCGPRGVHTPDLRLDSPRSHRP